MTQNSRSTIHDSFRDKNLIPTPEERLRLALVQLLTSNLSYPQELLCIERELRSLAPILPNHQRKMPHRRIDILVSSPPSFQYNGILYPCLPLKPLMLIECKANTINKKTLFQIIGYNNYIQAPYLVAASHKKIVTGCFDPAQKSFHFTEGIPLFQELIPHYLGLQKQLHTIDIFDQLSKIFSQMTL